MFRSKKQEDIRSLCDLYTPWSDEERAQIEGAYNKLGMGTLEPNAKPRQPYDSLYVKLKKQRDYWSRN